jgi:tetratricopeptide (TPR) repeat protein
MSMDEPSFTQLVTQVLIGAECPLTLEEIIARVEMIRPVDTRKPKATIRTTISNVPLAATLGGRPARYTWWPRHMADNSFRLPLAASDLEAGSIVLNQETWTALWPDFMAGPSRIEGDVTLALAGGPELQARIQQLVPRQAVWGLPPTPALAEWYRQQEARPEDDLTIRVLDVDARRYALALVHHADRDEAAIAARNQALADAAEVVVKWARMTTAVFDLIPRLIAHNAYRDPLPPDPWYDVLRADLRFVVGDRRVDLAQKIVDSLERDQDAPLDPMGSPRPRGNRHKARSEQARQEWSAYLFDQGMDYLHVGWLKAAEAYYREALRVDPGHADAWVHLGSLHFQEGYVVQALAHYEQGQAAAEARTIGDPARYPAPFWIDVDSRPFMRAVHGRGLCLWRLGRVDEARQVFTWMMELNPSDNQGTRFLLEYLDQGLSWEESMAGEEPEDWAG